jgi:hypothetical protein
MRSGRQEGKRQVRWRERIPVKEKKIDKTNTFYAKRRSKNSKVKSIFVS